VIAQAYREALQALLPPGAAWTREADAVLTALLDALAQELARVDVRADGLLDEADPRTTAELLADWERMAGLPDSCVTTTQTVSERRDALVARLTSLGGQSRQYFIDLAASLGYTITIIELGPFKAGHNSAGDAVMNDPWQFVWRVNAPTTTVRDFKAGSGAAGESLRSWGNLMLECAIAKLKPAHTYVQFSYA